MLALLKDVLVMGLARGVSALTGHNRKGAVR
jgi:hypothetical protein